MRPPAGVLLVIVLLSPMLSATPAGAVTPSELPLLAAGGHPGHGWVKFSVSTNGDPVALRIFASGIRTMTTPWMTQHVPMTTGFSNYGRPSQTWGSIYDSAGGELMGANLVYFVPYYADPANPGWAPEEGTMVLGGVGEVPFRVETPPEGSGVSSSFGFGLNFLPGGRTTSGDFLVVLYFAGDADLWWYEARGGAGARVTSVEDGDSTFFFTSQDFTAPARANVGSPAARGHAVLLGERSVHVNGRLFGAYTKLPCRASCDPQPMENGRAASVYESSLPTDALRVRLPGAPDAATTDWLPVGAEGSFPCEGWPGCEFIQRPAFTTQAHQCVTSGPGAPECIYANYGHGDFTFLLLGASAGLTLPAPGAEEVFVWGADVPLR